MNDGHPSQEILHAYFDDELPSEQRAEVESQLARDPALKREIDELAFLRKAVVVGLEREAQGVPAARFAQMWDEIDRNLDRDVRLRRETERQASPWSRLGSWVRSARAPVLVAAAAAILVLVLKPKQADESSANNPERVASGVEERMPTPNVQSDTRVADASIASDDVDTEVLAIPESNEADIQRIEFGGKTGRISTLEGRRGTTTVIWVTEDEGSADSERPL